MTVKEAWELVKKFADNKDDISPENISETEKYYLFTVKPKQAPHGLVTGMYGYIVHKNNKKVAYESFLSVVNDQKDIKIYNPDTFEILQTFKR